MLYYCPLESYKERYTMQWSAPKWGWLERHWVEAGVKYKRIEGDLDPKSNSCRKIKTGSVLDAIGRSKWCFTQVEQLLKLAEDDILNDYDTIYFDDFWHPGIEALAYGFHLMNIKPKMYAWCHAQSVDEFDFTYPMRFWMRNFEKGIGKILDGVFVNSQVLGDLLLHNNIATQIQIHKVGHVFCSEEVKERMGWDLLFSSRQNRVVFSSRWDKEKNPEFFLKVAAEVLLKRPNTQFVICTSFDKLKSNNLSLIVLLKTYLDMYPHNIILKEGLSKEEYYKELCEAKIQINTADQDFISIALLEASTAGCYPVYPFFRSFPEAFDNDYSFMYEHKNLTSASEKVIRILDQDDLWTPEKITARAWIHEKHDSTWKRMLNIMNIKGVK